MSVVFSATWQNSCLGLRASQPGRTALATLWAAFGSINPAKQLSHSQTSFPQAARPLRCPLYSTEQIRALHTNPVLLAKKRASPTYRLPQSLPLKAPIDKPLHIKHSISEETRPPPATKRSSHASPNSGSSSKDDIDADSSTPSQAELNAIFGQEIDRDGAAELLSKLQRQRREGTLDQEIPYPGQLVDKGLEYLRANYPVDEDAAIIARVDKEFDGDWSMPQTNPQKSRSGKSGLQEIRKFNRAKREADEAEREAEDKKAESKRGEKSGTLATRDGSKKGTLMTRGQYPEVHGLVVSKDLQERIMAKDAWIKASNERVAQLRQAATAKYIPHMSRWQRLWPSGVFVFSAVGLALIFARVYTPPSNKARLFPDIPPAAAAVGTVVALNFLVFILWRLPFAWKTMNRGFIVAPANPQPFSMLGAEFSHHQVSHIFSNMVGIWLLGTQGTFAVCGFSRHATDWINSAR